MMMTPGHIFAQTANFETPYIEFAQLDVVECSQNAYFRQVEFPLGYSCYKAIDERIEGFGTRLDLEKKGDSAIYELAAVSKISQIMMFFFNGESRQYDITIQAAHIGAHYPYDVNKAQWTTVFQGKTANVGINQPVLLTFSTPIEAQFIRIIGNGAYNDNSNTILNFHTSIKELLFFGQKTDEVYTYQNTATSTTPTLVFPN